MIPTRCETNARFHEMVGPRRELDRFLFDKKEKEKKWG
jgi:hypothetical protein